MQEQLEKLLAEQCGAVLMGVKPAALFTLEKADDVVQSAVCLLEENKISAAVLRQGKKRTLVLAYLPGLLRRTLNRPVVCAPLAQLGYPVGGGLAAMLAHLKARVRETNGFPHEVGFFLGYPACDVLGFIRHRGRNYKHCCMWKVYGDVEESMTLCEEYQQCRRWCCKHIEAGGRLATVPIFVKKAG